MADESQFGAVTAPDDELDFRPLVGQPAARMPAAQARPAAASDGIDFQPAAATSKTPRAVSQATDELDFRPAEKPATLESLYKAPQSGVSLTDRVARAGAPSSLAQSFAPKTYDLTQVPRSPFTNELEFGPPIATEEEARKNGVLRAAEPVTLPGPHGVPIHLTPQDEVQMAKSVLPGLDKGFLVHQPGMENDTRLLSFENALMNEKQQKEHPILTGASEFASGLTAPTNLGLIVATAGAEGLAGPAAQTVKRLIAAGFTAQMLGGAIQQVPEIADAVHRGDFYNAKRLMTHMVLGAGMAGLAARGTFEEPPPLTVPRGTISAPLAMDAAVERGSRKMQDFEANAAAREGMAGLAGAESGIEAAKQARINAPVEVPKTYKGEPPILPGRAQGPERNPLETEAARVREEREAQQPDFRVMDLRRVTPEEPGQSPYYEIAPAESRPSRRIVEPAPPGETVGARGRSATVSSLAERALADREKSLVTRFGPDVLEEARQELQTAAGLASSFERPGRYFAAIGQTDEPFGKEDPKLGIRHGGSWYGVTSARGMIKDMHPWFADVAEGPETFSRMVQKGSGAAYNRFLERVATHIQNERESAHPVIEEYAPHLESLAGQIRDTDPELAQTLQDLAQGKAVGFKNLKAYIEEKIYDAKAAATFSRAIEDAAAEARESAGAEESPEPGSEARAAEGRGEEAARQPAGTVSAREPGEIDFEPLPEPQPINPQEVEDLSRQLGRPITAEEIPGIRRRQAAERNIEAGLRGEHRDVAGEIREEHRAKLERGEILPGMEAAVREQREAAATEQGRQLTEEINRPPESIEETAGKIERESPLFRGKGPQGELYSGIHPRAMVEGARVLQRAWDEKVAQPLINKVLKIGDKYVKAREADPAVAEGLHLLDNAPQYLRAKAAQEVHNVIGDLSRAQERLFTLLADADSRENLRANHPAEYRQAMNDRAIQEALSKYRPLEQELTRLRQQMGGATLEDDYLRRIYERHVAGVNKPEAPSTSGERATSAYDRVIRPQRIGSLSREATAEYHYEHGLHEFGPAFATKFIGTHLRALRDQVAREFIDKATMLPAGASEPRFIMYGGERYYRPDVVREMRDADQKNVKAYDRYDPTAGEKFPVPADGKFLGPRELVKTLNDFGRREESEPGALRRFFQEQIIGFGFGIPHIANIMRRVSQSVPGGAVNPKGWVEAWKVALSKELRDRGIEGLNDPTFDMLAKHGAISTGEVANLKSYWGGNLNPANWARSMAQIGHKVLFEPTAAQGFGGIDQRARLYIADLLQSQRPELTDAQIAEAVRTQLGDYNRANWSDRQKMLARFMMFPGWDFSSVRWVLQHPVKTTVPPALVVLLANQALHQLGQNRSEDKYDIFNIHVGDRSYGTSLVRESVARNLFRPALAYAQAKIRGENDQRALAEAARGVTSGAGGLLSMMRPDLSGFLALATNRHGLFSGKEIVSKDDYAQPGKLLPSRAIEKQAVFALRHAVPALDRMLDSNEEIDLRSFAGGNLGVPNYRDDAEKRLYRNASEAEEVHRTIGKLAKTDPQLARQYVKDPDNAAFALFYHDLGGLAATLRRMDEAKQRIESSGLSSEDKKSRTATIDKARENLLRHADGLNNLLFERRQRGKTAVGIVPRSLSEDALRVLNGQR
ncbi:MAG: hypothetical protein LAN84_04160 [Acidobacteriia bacterium]|nr:hypothetical protein [Terriglobia bacterium]